MIVGFKTGPKGDPIVLVDPVPKGRKQTKEIKLFKVRYDKERAKEMKKKGARPIRIDKAHVLDLAKKISEKVERRVAPIAEERPGQPVSHAYPWRQSYMKFAVGPVSVIDVFGTELRVAIEVDWHHAVGGTTSKYVVGGALLRYKSVRGDWIKRSIGLTLDASVPATDILADLAGFQREVYRVLLHEVTHLADKLSEGAKGTGRGTEMTEDVYRAYVNDPDEVRANMQVVADDVLEYVRDIARKTEGWGLDQGRNIERGLELSPTWERIRRFLTPASRKLILKGVARAVDDEWEEIRSRYLVEDGL